MWDSKVLAAGVAIAACGFFAVVSQRKGAKAGGAVKISSEPGTLGKKGSSKKKEMGQEEPKTKMQEKPAASQAPKIEMYFGSQTGKAEELAKSLAAEGRLRGYEKKHSSTSLTPSSCLRTHARL
jgi:sulfite reductase alpha subunit-like flavoprotein